MKDQNLSSLGIEKEDVEKMSLEGIEFNKESNLAEGTALIPFSRPLSEYPTVDDIIAHLLTTGNDTQHVYTKDLNVGGVAIQDTFEKYLSTNDHLSSGVLKQANKSPLHLYFEWESGWKDELRKHQKDGNHFKLGTFLHEAVLEPTKFSRVIIEPKENRASTAGVDALCAFWEEKIHKEHEALEGIAEGVFIKAHEKVVEEGLAIDKMNGKKRYLELLIDESNYTAISEEDMIVVNAVKFNYDRYGDGIFYRLLKHSKREISMYATDPSTGLKVRIRPDSLAFEENIGVNAIISVKSTSADSIAEYLYQSAKFDYPISEGMYQEVASQVTGRDVNCTLVIMIQSKPPYGVALIMMKPEDIEAGKYKYHHALQTAKECIENDNWPGYDSMAEDGNRGIITDFGLPAFYRTVEEKPVNI